MAEINAKDVMNLRNRTGLPMMDCKQALSETKGDVAAAEDWLRKKLKGKMDKRTERAAGEGRIATSINSGSGSATMIELRAETDFTAKNEKFIQAAKKIADLAMNAHAGAVAQTPEMGAIIDDLRISTGENISLGRAHKVIGETGTTAYGSYVHHDGKTGVLVQATGSIAEETLREVCMHIAAATPSPIGITANDIPADAVERERRFRLDQAMESGKPKEIAEKMVEGGMRKFYEEVALMEQPFIKDEKRRVKDIVGSKAQIVAFFRWRVGVEG